MIFAIENLISVLHEAKDLGFLIYASPTGIISKSDDHNANEKASTAY